MENRAPTTASFDGPAQHSEHVCFVANGGDPADGVEEVSTSWRRSANEFHVDPGDKHAPSILTSSELKIRREPLEAVIGGAHEELDALYDLVCGAGYAVLFCDTDGVAIEHRGERRWASEFEHWGTWIGGVWTEAIEGTNGIGTCVAERRAVTVHRNQHFRSRHKDLSCSGAPVFADDGTLLAVLDVSAINPELSERAHALTGVLTVNAARAVEERLFRERFHAQWIVAGARPGGASILLAVDEDQRIVGADHAARENLKLDEERLAARPSLWSIFERDLAIFRHNDSGDFPAQLTFMQTEEIWPSLITPPAKLAGFAQNGASVALHTRPRLEIVRSLRQIAPAEPARSGIPAGVMRRLSDYVGTHLDETIDLATLAGIAGVSVFHFARQFKQTAGVTPHHYITQRRIARARELLARSDLPLADIAQLTGFADQGHFARVFRRFTDTTPRAFRWSSR